MTRRHDPRRAKAHRSYSAKELCELFDVNISTVRQWSRSGLCSIDGTWPHLFSGSEVARFIAGYNKPRQPTGVGQIYCVACKSVVHPVDSLVELVQLSDTNGDIVGQCPLCSRRIHQRVRLVDIPVKCSGLRILYEGDEAPVSSDGLAPHTDALEEI